MKTLLAQKFKGLVEEEESEEDANDNSDDDEIRVDLKLREMKKNLEEILTQENKDEDEDQKLLEEWENLQNDEGEYLSKSTSNANNPPRESNREPKDPFIKYGSGIMSFFHLQQQLIVIFSILSLFAAFQMGIMYSFSGLDYLGDKVSGLAKVSFGNMGFPQSVCSKDRIDWSENSETMKLMF